MFQDKVKQIIDRVKSNEVRYRDKHQGHKTDIAQVHREVNGDFDNFLVENPHFFKFTF